MHHTYRNIEPLNIEWCLTSWTIRLMCLIIYNFQICSKEKKYLGSTPPSKHIFLISPPSRIPRSKIEKKLRKCGQTSFISNMKLYTISLQNPNKKNSPVNFGASSLNFTGTLIIARILKSTLWRRWMYIIIDIFLIFLVSMNGKGYKFQLGIKFLYDDRLFVIWLKRLVTSFVRVERQ